MLGFNEEINTTWLSILNDSYSLDMPQDTTGVSFEKLTEYIPGVSNMITYKAGLITRGGKYIPKAFILPRQKNNLLAYQQLPENKEKLWIQKNLHHRGNKVKDIKDMDLDTDSIVQEYIANPYLIDDRRFSIAVFVVFTSINPMESLTQMALENNYNQKQALDAHIRSEGKSPDIIYSQITNAIRDVLNRSGARSSKLRGESRTKYYEITRWDFVLDEDLNVYLIEANHRPNMPAQHSTTSNVGLHYSYNVLYNVFRVIGIHDMRRFQISRSSIRDTDLSIQHQMCYNTSCYSCNTEECRLCPQCLSTKKKDILKELFLEHINRGENRLVLSFGETDIQKYYAHKSDLIDIPWFDYNVMMTEWFREKCSKDIYWCV